MRVRAELDLAVQRAVRATDRLGRADPSTQATARMWMLRDMLNAGLRAADAPEQHLDETKLARPGMSNDLLWMVLLYHSGGPWTPEKFAAWSAVMGRNEATTRGLCDAIREHLARSDARCPA